MKIFSVLFALFAVSEATSTFGLNKALSVRGGGEIGPIDGAMAMKISKTVATAYVAGSATKYIASNTGGGSTLVSLSLSR